MMFSVKRIRDRDSCHAPLRPASAVLADQASPENFEHDVQTVRIMRSIEHSEGTPPKGRGDIARIVPV